MSIKIDDKYKSFLTTNKGFKSICYFIPPERHRRSLHNKITKCTSKA